MTQHDDDQHIEMSPMIEMEEVGTSHMATRSTIVLPECSGSQPSSKEQFRGSELTSQEQSATGVVDLENGKDSKKGHLGQGRREMAPRSKMWDHFDKIKDKNNVVKVDKCKYCKRELKADTKDHGTSSLIRHFDVCKSNPHKMAKDPKQSTLQITQGEGAGTWRFDPDDLREAFAEMVIQDELPFCFGEKPGFRKFMSKACPCFKPPSRRTCSRDTMCLFFREKAKLKKFFKDSCQRVCLTTDCWTSQQLDGYMTVTASFIDESWSLHKKIIGFFLVKGHKGDDIGKNLVRCLTEWGLERVMTVTIDNATNNDGGISYLRRQLNKTNIANGKFLHMRCAAHIVNLIVQNGIKEVDVSVKRVRAAVRYIRNGGSRVVKF
uniref:BED-type domain-containing protein n=1 Tax=Triticum urartu TaxID=4572 RepID=A0A8R7Q5B9_TRIUA